jgi:ABC-type sugar transport system permease subunit
MLESSGLIGQLFGAGYINPLTDTSTATLTIVLYSFWGGFGTSLLVFVGAMNRVPSEIIDAGQIDGCGMGREFFSIIVPMVWETLSTMLLLTSMSVFTATGPILYFTRGNFETKTLSFFIFFETYNGSYNYPSAVGMFFTIIALPIVAFGRWLMNRANAQVQY